VSHCPIKGDYVPRRFHAPSVVTLQVAGEDIGTLTAGLDEGSHGPILVSGGLEPDRSSADVSPWFSWVLVSPGTSADSLRVTAIDDDRLGGLAAVGQPLWTETSIPIPGAMEEQQRRIEELRKQRESRGPSPTSAPAAGPTRERIWRRVGTVIDHVPTPQVIADNFDLAERHPTRRPRGW
jgi:hypothetical protein